MRYTGSCHCGHVAFEAEGEIAGLLECNCSICRRKGALMWFVPRSAFRLLTPEENAATYTFASGRIHHRFCPRCGIQPYGEGDDPTHGPMVAINARCLDNVDLAALPVRHFDGASL